MRSRLYHISFLILILSSGLGSWAQTLTLSGTVTAVGRVQDDVLIDIYEYNAAIQTLHTDEEGAFTFPILKGREYLIVFYKSGYMLQSISITDSRDDRQTAYTLRLDLQRDEASPEGLYFQNPVRRIAPESTMSYFTDSKFDLSRIKPRHRSDSLLVLLNRARANQYILVNNIRLNTGKTDDKYTRQVEDGINRELRSYTDKMKQNSRNYDSIYAAEEKNVRESKQAKNEEQLARLTEAQRLLAARLAATAEYYQLSQLSQLAEARLDEIKALKQQRELVSIVDSSQRKILQDACRQTRSGAVNHRYLAMDANRKLQLYNKYQVLNYQEYIELLRYKEGKDDTLRPTALPVKVQTKPAQAATVIDTTDNLSKVADTERSKLIQQALDEEERFENYEEKQESRKINGIEVKVTDIHIADDYYEMQVDKKGFSKYFKNNKPVTKLTFDFETTRKMVDVLKTIKEVGKFGR